MKKLSSLALLFLLLPLFSSYQKNLKSASGRSSKYKNIVADSTMERVYEEIKTPYKYGLVMVPPPNKMVDSPSIFRHGDIWYMTYILFDGKGYETWLAKSENLLNWETSGRILSFTEDTWDSNQKAGYIALQDYRWGGSYEVQKYDGRYWISYLGGKSAGYEAGILKTGIAYTEDITRTEEWKRVPQPVLSPEESDARWYDNQTIYKSTIIWDRENSTGYPFVMFYNAKGRSRTDAEAERIAMAVSTDMINWKRFGRRPVIDHGSGISGDAFITKIDNIWVMFYFGAFWKPGAFDRFACSYDLINWTCWKGEDLVKPSEDFDNRYAHKPYVIKYNGVVYHFYCAVDRNDNRGIAVATSIDMGKSKLLFN